MSAGIGRLRRHGIRAAAIGRDAGRKPRGFGETAYPILVKYLHLRELLRPYVRELMQAAHERGTPVMRPLFYEFPDDARCWEIEDEYMFGGDLLVAPILEAGARDRTVYLPTGARWTDPTTGAVHEGGQTLTLPAPLDTIPVLIKNGRDLSIVTPD